MTPKEKAIELVDSIYWELENQYKSKQCALITVEELLKARPCLPICISTDGGSSEALIDANNFWNEVKKELELL